VENRKDIDEIPDNVKSRIKFILAADMDTVLCNALVPEKAADNAEDAGKDRKHMLLAKEDSLSDGQAGIQQM
jgi:ATP-dependent Lon protease